MNGYQKIHAILEQALATSNNIHLLGEALELSPDTHGLLPKYPEQCHLLPASDNAMLGLAIGMAFVGSRPILHLAGPQSLWTLLAQLGQEVSNSGAEFPLPIIIRVPVGPNEQLMLQQLQHLTGICVAAPSSAAQAAAMLEAALEAKHPTLLIEDRQVLQESATQPAAKDIQHAEIPVTGDQSTLVAWGAAVHTAQEVALELQQSGISVEVVDLRILHPVDSQTLCHSINKTGRPIFVDMPTTALEKMISGAFWRLENQPQNISHNREKMKEAIFASLRY